MRKLMLQMQTSIDGFVARPGGELDWMTWDWDEALQARVSALHENVDCILLGRKMTEGFVSTWAQRLKDDPSDASARLFVETPKVVFTRTLSESQWGDNTSLAKGELTEAVGRMKQDSGGDMMVYGGAEFVSELIKHNLIDEYHFFVNPAAIREGMTIFREPGKTPLKLQAATPYDCGIVELVYVPAAEGA
jgi:dihydrofolate reductase